MSDTPRHRLLALRDRAAAADRGEDPRLVDRHRRGLVVVACAIGWFTPFPGWSVPIFIVAALVGSVFPAQRAWQSIRRGSLDINVLMVIAVAGAIVIREYEEAAMVVSLFAAAQWLEAQSLDRARKAIGKLLDLAPTDRAGARRERRAAHRHRTGRRRAR